MEISTESLSRAAYCGMLYAALPLLVPYGVIKAGRRGQPWPDLARRLGWGLGKLGAARRDGVWIHGVSYGEIGVARRLAARVQDAHLGPVVLSATTATGLTLARSSREVEAVLPFPLDYPFAVRRFFAAVRPRALVLVEAEVWPNLLAFARREGVPVALVNGRVTDRSFAGYTRFHALFAPAYAGLSLVAVREEVDAERARRLGARPERVLVTGDLKFDLPPPVSTAEEVRAELRLGPSRLWIAGSTVDGEEEAVLSAHRAALRVAPSLVLVLAPRHPERFEAVAAAVRGQGLALARRSRKETPVPGGVLLLDTLGELREAYVAADFAFVGGSLVARGGHNVIEPAAAGVGVLSGSHTLNFAGVVTALVDAGGLVVVRGGEELKQQVTGLAGDRERAIAMGVAAKTAVERNRGALDRTLRALLPLLSAASSLPRARRCP